MNLKILQGYYVQYQEQLEVSKREMQEYPIYEQLKGYVPPAQYYKTNEKIRISCGRQEQIVRESIEKIIASLMEKQKAPEKGVFGRMMRMLYTSKSEEDEYREQRRCLFSLLNLHSFLVDEKKVFDPRLVEDKYKADHLQYDYLFLEISELMRLTGVQVQLI